MKRSLTTIAIISLLFLTGCKVGFNSTDKEAENKIDELSVEEECKEVINEYLYALETEDEEKKKNLESAAWRNSKVIDYSLGEDNYDYIKVISIKENELAVEDFINYGHGKWYLKEGKLTKDDIHGFDVEMIIKWNYDPTSMETNPDAYREIREFILIREADGWKIDDYGFGRNSTGPMPVN